MTWEGGLDAATARTGLPSVLSVRWPSRISDPTCAAPRRAFSHLPVHNHQDRRGVRAGVRRHGEKKKNTF